MKIVFIRHGESMGNVWGGAYADDSTNFLSLRGVKQAELSAYTIHDWMPDVDVVIASDLTRARQTAITVTQTMGDWKRAYQCDGRLNEWCWDAPGSADWYLAEPYPQFWVRVREFYNEVIKPNADLDANFLIVSHYYTMVALFEIIKEDLGLPNEVDQPLDIDEHGGIPNAIPWFYDTADQEPPRIILPGHKDVSR